jgi:type IV secretory pathway TraG/TraD family ATPase VirD4
MDIFASSILSLPEDKDRRIWLIIDELPSLNKLKSLKRILAESRKYGCCVVIGYQSYSEVESIYGKKGAESLSDLTASKIFFRSNDYFNANHTSQQLGKEEIKTTNENLAMGAHQGRDSISITETEKHKYKTAILFFFFIFNPFSNTKTPPIIG